MADVPKLTGSSQMSEACLRGDAALARAFTFLGKRWNAVILGVLGEGSAGFRELSRAIGPISDSVLSQRLAELSAAGLITRAVEPGPPVSVAYALTECGQALLPALAQVARWADEYLPPGGRRQSTGDRGGGPRSAGHQARCNGRRPAHASPAAALCIRLSGPRASAYASPAATLWVLE